MRAASARAAVSDSGIPTSISPATSRPDKSSGPRTIFAAAPPGRRNLIIQDFEPDFSMIKYRLRAPASRMIRRSPVDLYRLAAASVSILAMETPAFWAHVRDTPEGV